MMGTMISLKQLQALATAYGDALDTAVSIDIATWRYGSGNERQGFKLWVEKTSTHYDYDTAEEMIAAVRMKTLLHKKWSLQ